MNTLSAEAYCVLPCPIDMFYHVSAPYHFYCSYRHLVGIAPYSFFSVVPLNAVLCKKLKLNVVARGMQEVATVRFELRPEMLKYYYFHLL